MTNVIPIDYLVIICIVLYAIIAYLQGKKPTFRTCIVIGVLTLMAGLLLNYIYSTLTGNTGGSADSSVSKTIEGSDELVTLIGGVQAPASDFLFPESIDEFLTVERMDQVLEEGAENKIDMSLRSQMAINEILARYGYIFNRQDTKSAKEAREKFYGKEWYQQLQGKYPSNETILKENYFTEAEKANYQALIDWQVKKGVDFYVGLDGRPFRD